MQFFGVDSDHDEFILIEGSHHGVELFLGFPDVVGEGHSGPDPAPVLDSAFKVDPSPSVLKLQFDWH